MQEEKDFLKRLEENLRLRNYSKKDIHFEEKLIHIKTT